MDGLEVVKVDSETLKAIKRQADAQERIASALEAISNTVGRPIYDSLSRDELTISSAVIQIVKALRGR